jgi:diguanylate cyclase
MKRTDQSLLEQMQVTHFEIMRRKELFAVSDEDEARLKNAKPVILAALDEIVEEFYEAQTNTSEIALLIGDSDTLRKLKLAQRDYIISLFSGQYDLNYINSRLRIGMVHKRIGVGPHLYLAAVQSLSKMLRKVLDDGMPEDPEKESTLSAVQKIIMFDVSYVFDTYIRSMVAEVENAKQKSDSYASVLEDMVRKRTSELEQLSRTDPLTGLLNMRLFDETVRIMLRSAKRRNEPIAAVYIDINDFKAINDTHGHKYGDDILKLVANAIKEVTRLEDLAFRCGGDEFIVLLANSSSVGGEKWKQRLLAEMSKEKNAPSIACGIVHTGPGDYMEFEDLVTQADQKMYEDKNNAKTQVQ